VAPGRRCGAGRAPDGNPMRKFLIRWWFTPNWEQEAYLRMIRRWCGADYSRHELMEEWEAYLLQATVPRLESPPIYAGPVQPTPAPDRIDQPNGPPLKTSKP